MSNITIVEDKFVEDVPEEKSEVTEEKKEIVLYGEQSLDVLEQAKAIEIANQQDYDVASVFKKAAIDLEDKIKKFFLPMKRAAKAAHQKVCDQEKECVKSTTEAVRLLKQKTKDWDLAEEKRLQDEADKLARELAEKAENVKLEQAEKLEAEGKTEEAEQVLSAPIQRPVFSMPKRETPKGVHYQDNWTFKIEDETKIPREYLMVDEKKIRGVVKTMKNKTNIPGVRAFNDRTQVNRK